MAYSEDNILERVQEHLDAALAAHPCDWFMIAVQGSWNYGMADAESDVDTKMLTLPSFEELVFNKKPMNKVYIMPNDEHCDMKDTREYFKIFRKSNINFVEIIFSNYYIVNPKYVDLWEKLQKNKEKLARINPYAAVSCMKGMSLEKKHALCHEYPSRMPWIEKYGYDPKQLSHIARIFYFITGYVCGLPYKDCIYPKSLDWRNYLLQCKRNGNGRTKEEAELYADILVERISSIADEYRKTVKNSNDPEMDALLDDVLYQLMERSLKGN